jgi:molybdate transport system substrate-binding protein
MSPPLMLVAGVAKAPVERLLAEGAFGPEPPETVFGTAGAIAARALADPRVDVVLTSEDQLARVATSRALAGSLALGRVATALGAAAAAPRPAIDGVEAFRAALLAAGSIAWADPAQGATAGRHFEAVIRRLGIEAEMRRKARIFPFGVEAVAACSRGEVELVVSQSSEIAAAEGVLPLGTFPAPFALETPYAAAALQGSDSGLRLLAVLAAARARGAFAACGFLPKEGAIR